MHTTHTTRRANQRRVRRMIRPAAVLAALIALPTAAAHAAAGPYSVIGTGSNGLNERAAPSTSAALVGHLANGTVVYIACQVAGTPYSTGGSPASDSIWDQLTNGAYVADYWLSTPAVGTFSPGIPQCGAPPPSRAWGVAMSYNPGASGNCTWWAEYRFHAFTGEYANVMGPWSGGAYTYGEDAQAHNWTVTTSPGANSIVVFQPGVTYYRNGAGVRMSSVGHVGWVTAVNGSQITVSEMNFVGLGVTDTATYTVQQGRAPDGLPAMQFILAP